VGSAFDREAERAALAKPREAVIRDAQHRRFLYLIATSAPKMP
jgi:hypothetical protein